MSGTGKTPGQCAYEAYWANRPPVAGIAIAIPADWNGEPPAVRAQWEAAAKAAVPGFSMLVDELREALVEAAGHVEPVDQNSELAIGRWRALAGLEPAITGAGTEHIARQLLDERDPGGPFWQPVPERDR